METTKHQVSSKAQLVSLGPTFAPLQKRSRAAMNEDEGPENAVQERSVGLVAQKPLLKNSTAAERLREATLRNETIVITCQKY